MPDQELSGTTNFLFAPTIERCDDYSATNQSGALSSHIHDAVNYARDVVKEKLVHQEMSPNVTADYFMQKIKVVIADDNPVLLLGVRELIKRDKRFSVTGEALCSEDLINILTVHPPDLVISDYNMPSDSPPGDGLKLVKYLKEYFPKIKVLILTMIPHPLIITRLYALGVFGIIAKNQLHSEIKHALDAVAQRKLYQSINTMHNFALNTSDAKNVRLQNLSIKELEVLRLFVAGFSVSAIARQQSRSIKTISTQKVSAMRKLEITSDLDLLTYYRECRAFNY
eukprot:gene5901-6830_t